MAHKFLIFNTVAECQNWIDILNPKMGYPKSERFVTYTEAIPLLDGRWACLICDNCISVMEMTQAQIDPLKTPKEMRDEGLLEGAI